ncbi:ImpA family type VI secretion system protein [Collimonas humicola]|uniref:type VI secretion system protein TssA n=1 Tax=Collimonas humicola TaxID=2825886 RepID=UPI001B8C174A|nr:type VI secretion system ImpA family N-terminal domain-containing protein [Collimonas humicola]
MLNKLTQTLHNLMGTATPEWLTPLSDSEPCGPNLEYDPEYMLLMAKAAPRNDAQYGDFVDTPEGPNWADIERDCQRLLLRSRDITLLVLLLRSRTRSAQAAGLQEGLTRLVGFLEHYPEHIHPQLLIEGERDFAMRANALSALADPEGLLSDIRDITLSKSSAIRLQVRDVERAFASPRHPDALSVEVVQRQLADLRHARNPALQDLSEASVLIGRLQLWCQSDLQDYVPDLAPLVRLLGLFASKSGMAMAKPVESPTPDAKVNKAVQEPRMAEVKPSAPSQGSLRTYLNAISDQRKPSMTPTDMSNHTINGRQAALQAIQEAREWFELVEPSSPVAILLRQAEKMVGKRFSEVAQSIPPDLLARWEQE